MGHPVFLPFFLWHISLFHLYVTGYIVISLAEHWMIGSRYRGYLKECTYSSHYLHNVDYNLNYTLPSLGVFEGLSSVIGLLGRKGLLHQTWVTAPGRGAPLLDEERRSVTPANFERERGAPLQIFGAAKGAERHSFTCLSTPLLLVGPSRLKSQCFI